MYLLKRKPLALSFLDFITLLKTIGTGNLALGPGLIMLIFFIVFLYLSFIGAVIHLINANVVNIPHTMGAWFGIHQLLCPIYPDYQHITAFELPARIYYGRYLGVNGSRPMAEPWMQLTPGHQYGVMTHRNYLVTFEYDSTDPMLVVAKPGNV